MSNEQRPAGVLSGLQPGTLVKATVLGSVVGYFAFGLAVANIIAVVGGIALTVVLITREQGK